MNIKEKEQILESLQETSRGETHGRLILFMFIFLTGSLAAVFCANIPLYASLAIIAGLMLALFFTARLFITRVRSKSHIDRSGL